MPFRAPVQQRLNEVATHPQKAMRGIQSPSLSTCGTPTRQCGVYSLLCLSTCGTPTRQCRVYSLLCLSTCGIPYLNALCVHLLPTTTATTIIRFKLTTHTQDKGPRHLGTCRLDPRQIPYGRTLTTPLLYFPTYQHADNHSLVPFGHDIMAERYKAVFVSVLLCIYTSHTGVPSPLHQPDPSWAYLHHFTSQIPHGRTFSTPPARSLMGVPSPVHQPVPSRAYLHYSLKQITMYNSSYLRITHTSNTQPNPNSLIPFSPPRE